MDFGTDSIKIPISSPGELTFQYGSTPITYNFPTVGIWNITFSQDWNTIVSANYLTQLPGNRIYYPTNLNNVANQSSNVLFIQQGFQMPINVTLQNGSNHIQIYANSTLEYDSLVSATSNEETMIALPTQNLTIANYNITAYVNGNCTNFQAAAVTYPGDLSGHFKVDYTDLELFVSDYIAYLNSGNQTSLTLIDYNHDGTINFRDLTIFVHDYISYQNGWDQ
jgi:hypothetical protein